MIKKVIACALCLCFIISFSCNSVYKKSYPEILNGSKNILRDVYFKNGIHILGTDAVVDKRTKKGYIDYMGTAGVKGFTESSDIRAWELTQWDSKNNLAYIVTETKKGDEYIYSNPSKEITVNPKKGIISLEVFSDVDYNYEPRQNLNSWVHLLIEQNFDKYYMNQLNNIYAYLDFSIDNIVNHLNEDEYNPLIHSTQLVWYFQLINKNDTTKKMWFGIPLYDYRAEQSGEVEGEGTYYDKNTKMYIYCIDQSFYLGEKGIKTGERKEFTFEITKYIKTAFENAQVLGALEGCSFDDMYLDAMNMGWEVPGNFTCKATFYNVGLFIK